MVSRSETRLLWLLTAVQLTILLDYMVLMPLGPQLMTQLGIDAARFGQIVSAYTFASAACGFLGARLLDRIDRRRALLALYACFSIATLACALATSATGLLLARIAAGAAAGLVWSVALALIVDVFPPERRGHALGVVMSAYAISAVIGVPTGLALAGIGGSRAPFLLVFALSVLIGAGLFVMRDPSRAHVTPDDGSSTAWTSASYLGWALTFCVVFAGFLLIPFLGTFMVKNLALPASDLALIYLAGGAASFFTSRVIGALVDRYGAPLVLGGLLVATVAPHLLFTHQTSSSLPQLIALFVAFMTLTSGRVIPTIALITEDVPPAQRGRFMAINTAVSDVASGSAAWIGGMVLGGGGERLEGFGALGWAAVSFTGICLLILGSIVLARREPAAAPS